MNRHNDALMDQYRDALTRYVAEQFPLPGILNNQQRDVFIKQLIDSVRRIEYVARIADRDIDPERANPDNAIMFDPLRAALLHKSAGNFDEACWLIFLLTHFGKHAKAGWRYPREVYGKLGAHPFWTWNEVSADPAGFRDWLRNCQGHLLRGRSRGFGNHRKFTSMDADKANGTGAAIVSYVAWAQSRGGGHQALFQHALDQSEGDPKRAFNHLFRSMSAVRSFSRLGKFDYLTMLGKTALVPITPGLAYLAGSSGPRLGANRAFGPGLSTREKETRCIALAEYLGVGMQEIEDSLCNWNKRPDAYVYFGG